MTMKVIINDNDIIKLIVDFLQSRNLYHSAESAQLEAEVDPEEPQDVLLTLKKFIFQGRLLDTRQYLEPFLDLYKETFPTKKLLPILFRQQFCEVCFDEKKKASTLLKDTTKDMEGLFTEEEFNKMMTGVQSYWQSLCDKNTTSVSMQQMSRKDAFKDIASLVSPFLPERTGQASQPGNKLKSLLINGLLYDQCAQYCHGRASGAIPSNGLIRNTAHLNTSTEPHPPDAALYYWITNIKDNDVFTREHPCEDLQIVNSPRNIRPSQPDTIELHHNGMSSNVNTSRQNGSLLNPWGVTFSEATTIIDEPPDNSKHPVEPTKIQAGSNISNNSATNKTGRFKKTVRNPMPTKKRVSIDVNSSKNPDKSLPSGQQVASNGSLPSQNDSSSTVKTEYQKPTPKEPHQSRSAGMVTTSSNNIPVEASVRDSYSNYVAERESARENYNKIMEDIRQKEERANSLRKNLMPGATQDQGDGPRNASPLPATTLNSPIGNGPSVTQNPTSSLNAGRPSMSSSLVGVTSPLVAGQVREANSRPPTGHMYPGGQTKLSNISPKRPYGLEYSYHPLEKTEDLAAIRAVAFHPRGAAFAVGSNSHVLKLCAVPKQALTSQPRTTKTRNPEWMHLIAKRSQVHQGSIYSLAWNEQGNILATCSNDKLIKIFNYDHDTQVLQGPQYHLGHHDGVIRDVTFLTGYSNSSMLASGGGSDFVVYTYACDVDTVVHQLNGHSDQVLSLYSWPKGLLASASQDRSVRLWDLRTARCISVLGFGTSSDQHAIPTSVCVDGTGNYLAVGRDDKVVSLYDLKAGKSVSEFTVHSGEVRSVRFHPMKSNILLTSSYDGTAVVTDTSAIHADFDATATTSFKCSHHKDKVIQCRWHPDGMSFATTSADQSCVLWGARDL